MHKRSFSTVMKYIWASPATSLGICAGFIAVLLGATVNVFRGVLEISLRPRSARVTRALARLPYAAITFGHVVIAQSEETQNLLRAHERVHVAQYEKWGLAFFIAYPLESVLQRLQGNRPYLDNRFEVSARSAAAQIKERRAPLHALGDP
jgi:hypothetical protein